MGCLNNLRDVHNFYCPLASTIKKDSRDLFVKGTPDDIRGNFQVLTQNSYQSKLKKKLFK